MNAVCLTIGNMPGLPQELIDERRPLFRVNLDPEELRAKRALVPATGQCPPCVACRGAVGRSQVPVGTARRPRPTCRRIIRSGLHGRTAASEVNELIAFAGMIDPWYKRVAAIGHGTFSEMTPDQAIEVARTNEPDEPRRMVARGCKMSGLGRGDWVSVTPDDYGNPVYGSILAWTADEMVIRHEDPSVGKVNFRFPRVGFDAAPAERKAA